MGETSTPPPISEIAGDPPCRRFTLLDGMILIIAAACWMALARPVISMLWDGWNALRRQGLSSVSRPDIWLWAILIMSALLRGVLILTPTFLVLRLRRPRPPWRRLIWQPGMMACLLVFVVFLPLGLVWNDPRGALLLSGSVAVSWLAAWWSGRLHPEPGWIDRLGRFLGACWIAMAGYLLLFR